MVILSGEPPSRRLTASTLLNSVGAALMTASPAARNASMTPLMPGVLMSTMTLNDSPWGVGGEGGRGGWGEEGDVVRRKMSVRWAAGECRLHRCRQRSSRWCRRASRRRCVSVAPRPHLVAAARDVDEGDEAQLLVGVVQPAVEAIHHDRLGQVDLLNLDLLAARGRGAGAG